MKRKEFLKNSGLVALSSVGLGSVYYAYSDWQEKERQKRIIEMNRRGYNQRYHTTAHEFLDLANEIGAMPSDRWILDNIIDRALAISVSKKKKKLLEDIGGIIEDEGIRKSKENIILHEGLEKGKLDCVGLSVIYYSIDELRKDLNLTVVVAPNHVFLRCYFDSNYFNWDPIKTKVFDDDFYRQEFNISKGAEGNGVFLRDLDKNGMLSLQYEKLGFGWHDRGDVRKSLGSFKKAVELDSLNSSAFHNIGSCYYKNGDYRNAIKWYEKAVELDPNFSRAYYNLANAYKNIGDSEKYKYYLNKADSLK